MKGKLNAIGLTLLIIASALAGCTSDPDGMESSEIDADTLDLIEQLLMNNSVGPEWINDRGDSSQLWGVSLEEDQWLEVKSAVSVLEYEGELMSYTSFVRSSEGFAVSSGFSPIFGGNYSWCAMSFGEDLPCANEDPDGDWTFSEWTIIYRVH